MGIAIIDMGTNTFHLLIVNVEKGDFQVRYREKIENPEVEEVREQKFEQW